MEIFIGSNGRLEYEQYDLQINKPRPRKFRQAGGSSPKHHIHPVLAVLALQYFMRHVGTKCSDVRAVFYKRRVLCVSGLTEGGSKSRDLTL